MQGYILHKSKKIHFRDQGEGNTIVLLHGFLENMGMWNYYVKKLSAKYRIITIDLPGFGKSDCLGRVHLMEQMASVVNKVLKNREVKKCVMLGHSMGGYVTLAFASKFPGKLKGFGLLHSHAMADTAEAKLNRNRAIEIVNSDKRHFIFNFFPELFAPENVEKHQKEIQKLYADAVRTSPRSIVAALEGMKYRFDRLNVLVKSKVPVLFVLGKKDSRIPLQKTLDQATLPSTSEILVLDKVGHMGHIEARKKVLKTIESFASKSFE
jgi:pimeloyl-ACP methyl ester carboxylesterase